MYHLRIAKRKNFNKVFGNAMSIDCDMPTVDANTFSWSANHSLNFASLTGFADIFSNLGEDNRNLLWENSYGIALLVFWSHLNFFRISGSALISYLAFFILLAVPLFASEKTIMVPLPKNVKEYLKTIEASEQNIFLQQFASFSLTEQSVTIVALSHRLRRIKFSWFSSLALFFLLSTVLSCTLNFFLTGLAGFMSGISLMLFSANFAGYYITELLVRPDLKREAEKYVILLKQLHELQLLSFKESANFKNKSQTKCGFQEKVFVGVKSGGQIVMHRVDSQTYMEHCLKMFFENKLTFIELDVASRSLNTAQKTTIKSKVATLKRQYYFRSLLSALTVILPSFLLLLSPSKVLQLCQLLFNAPEVVTDDDLLFNPKILYFGCSLGVGRAIMRFFKSKAHYVRQCQEVDQLFCLQGSAKP